MYTCLQKSQIRLHLLSGRCAFTNLAAHAPPPLPPLQECFEGCGLGCNARTRTLTQYSTLKQYNIACSMPCMRSVHSSAIGTTQSPLSL